MESDKASLGREDDRAADRSLGEPDQSIQLRLHARMMAAAYKYKLMSPEEDGNAAGEGRYRSGVRTCWWAWVVVVILLVLLLALFASLFFWTLSLSDCQQPCVTQDCVDVSAYILRKMNASADPCKDFYAYSCGGWEHTTFVPPEKAKFDTFAQVHKNNEAILKRLLDDKSTMFKGKDSTAVAKLKVYFRTCMDLERIENDGARPILKVIEKLGSWSVAAKNKTGGDSDDGNDLVDPQWDFVTHLVKFHQLGEAPLFSFGLGVDSKNSSRYLLSFAQAGLTLGSEEEYYKNNSAKFKKAFLKFAVGVGKLLGGDASTLEKMTAVYEFETELAKIFMGKEKLIDPDSRYNLMTVEEFQKLIGDAFDIKNYMSLILNKTVHNTQVVNVVTKDYFEQLGQVVKKTSNQVLQDYFVWHMLQQLPGYLPQAFVDAAMELNQVEFGVTAVAPRWQRCVRKAEDALGYASAALYVQQTFPPESKVQALEILSDVQESFLDNLDRVKWMDKETKDRAIEKARAMGMVLGYPDWILDPNKLDTYYENVTVKEGAFLENYFNVAKSELDRMWSKIDKHPNKHEWSMLPDEVNAFFSSTYNQIVVLAGLLQRPYFDRKYPLSFVYGSMGMISGHELTHGFDNLGRRFDKDGNMNDWWTPASEQSFKDHSKCMVNQYSKFQINGTHFNGKFTLAENIADNAGLKLGYLAYEKKRLTSTEQKDLPGLDLTPNQLFFVGFAQIWCAHYTPEYAQHAILSDEHTHAKYRVLGSLANFAPFSEAFNCPAGSALNPQHKCHVW